MCLTYFRWTLFWLPPCTKVFFYIEHLSRSTKQFVKKTTWVCVKFVFWMMKILHRLDSREISCPTEQLLRQSLIFPLKQTSRSFHWWYNSLQLLIYCPRFCDSSSNFYHYETCWKGGHWAGKGVWNLSDFWVPWPIPRNSLFFLP